MSTADLKNYRHGRLLVKDRVWASRNPILWWYRCDCGNWGTTTAKDVKRKNKKTEKSCGCARHEYAKELASGLRFKDLTNKRFGRLIVLKLEPKTNSSHRRWLCRCDCGKTKSIASTNLLQRRTISCGCYQREIAPELALRMSAHRRIVFTAQNRITLTSTLRYYRVKDATPPWVSKKELREIYKNCPEGFHVDHIHPIRHPLLCGLHVPWNLQYLPAADNLKKRNRLVPTHVPS